MFDTDVFIAGGGPAGLAAAIAARRSGLSVTLADACCPPIDKACGEGLLPDSLAAAAALGISLPDQLGHPFRGIRFVRGAAHAEAEFRDSQALGVRRTVLQQLLIEHAERAGVHFLWGTSVAGMDGHAVHLRNARLTARWIVGADGGRSRVRAWAGLDACSRNHVRYGFRRHYGVPPWSEFVEVYWGRNAQVYITPLASDEIGVASLSRDPHLRLDDALALLPDVRARLLGAPVRSSLRGAVTATRRLHRVVSGHVALIGDASGSVDAITGQGIGLAFLQAQALGAALAGENLALYQAAHRRIMRRRFLMAELLLAMDRWPSLGSRAIGALHDRPGLFARLLDAHTGHAQTAGKIATRARLGWRMLRG